MRKKMTRTDCCLFGKKILQLIQLKNKWSTFVVILDLTVCVSLCVCVSCLYLTAIVYNELIDRLTDDDDDDEGYSL